MKPKSDEKKLIEWLNTLIVMAQWDKNLPLYFGRLFTRPDQYQLALPLIRQTPPKGPLPSGAGDALSNEEWEKLYKLAGCVPPLRQLFAGDRDPFQGALPNEIFHLSELSDLTSGSGSQTTLHSRNGTFHLVLESVRQTPQIDTKVLITDSLNKFYTLLGTNPKVTQMLYELACSNDWHVVLASLYAARDYTADENASTKETLKTWNRSLTKELREILLQPTMLFRVPKSLVRLAWERKGLFDKALDSIPRDTRLTGAELRKQVSHEAYKFFAGEAKDEVETIEAELQLVADVARHYIGIRKFAKLDGLVYAWPRIAALAMANYKNWRDVEELFLKRTPRPKPEEFENQDVRELYELCEHNEALLRFLRLQPHFKEIKEDELRRHRSLAPGIPDPVQHESRTPMPQDSRPPAPPPSVPPTPPTSMPMEANTSISPEPPPPDTTPVTQSVATQSRTCELMIKPSSPFKSSDFVGEEMTYDVSFTIGSARSVANKDVAEGKVVFSIRELIDRMLGSLGASETNLQAVLKNLFVNPHNAEQMLVRAGSQLFNTIITQTGLDDRIGQAFIGDAPVRLIISSDMDELHYVPWEWLPRPGYTELLLLNPRFSVVRCRNTRYDMSVPAIYQPIRIMGVFPNSPVGSPDPSESSMSALSSLASEGAYYKPLVRNEATLLRVNNELEEFAPNIVHFEGYVRFAPEQDPNPTIMFSSLVSTTEPADLARFQGPLFTYKIPLLVIGRNESSRVVENTAVILSSRLSSFGLPAVLAPIRAVDDVTATSMTTEFYRAFLAGSTVEKALHTARSNVGSKGGDWTSFALFANPEVLNFLQPVALE